MKLTKSKLIKAVMTHLEKMEYTFFNTNCEDIVFSKQVCNGLYLTLYLTIHRFYDDQFTGNFTLSPTMHYLSFGGPYPFKMCERVGMLLTKSERMLYADESETEDSVDSNIINPAIAKMMQELGLPRANGEFKDCWWIGLDGGTVLKFLDAVRITEPRFLNNQDLVNEILSNTHIQRDVARQEKVMAYLGKTEQYKDYKYLPARCLCAPIEWYQAAELLAIEEKSDPKYCKFFVRDQAENAYRVYMLQTRGISI